MGLLRLTVKGCEVTQLLNDARVAIYQSA